MSAAALAAEPAWRPRGNPWAIALVVTLAAFMEILDSTIVNVSLPHIAGSMGASNDESTWTLTSYLVANGIVLAISAWLGSVLGRKRYFLICIVAFTLFSFLCGVAQSLPELIVFRLLQGFFGGGLQPNQQAILLDTFPAAQRGRAMSVVAIATVIAPVLGPTLGGLITDNASWRWIFLLNVPIGVLCFFGVAALVEDPPWAVRSSRRLDAVGLGLITLGIGCLQVMLDRGEDADWFDSGFIRAFAALALLGLIGAALWLVWTRHPIVDVRVLKDRNFAVGCLMVSATMGVLYSSAVLLPLMSQTVLGYTSTLAGYLLSPGALMLLLLIPVVARLMPLVQTRVLVFAGFVMLGLALLYSQRLVPGIDFDTLVLMRMAQTAGLAFLFVPITTISYATLPPAQRADAVALNVMFRNIAGSIGIAVSTALVTSTSQVRMAYMTAHLTPLDQPYLDLLHHHVQTLTAMGHTVQEATGMAMGLIYQTLRTQAAVLAYSDVFRLSALMAFAAAPFAFLFTAARGTARAGGH
jgi:DHA2 family multidrug resistance protein